MIKHIVLFKLKPFDDEAAKKAVMSEIKTKLEALIHIIPELKKIEVGLNINPAEQWDVALVTEFEKMEDLPVYANHPAHVAISKDIIASVKEGRACVDFIF